MKLSSPLAAAIAALVLLTPTAADAEPIVPRETPIGETAAGAPCAVTPSGSGVVLRDTETQGWTRWTAETGLQPISGEAANTREAFLSADGRYLTQWRWAIGASGLVQLDTSTGAVRTIVEARSGVAVGRPAVSGGGDRVTWFETRRSGDGPTDFIGVRQWNRSSGLRTLVDLTSADWDFTISLAAQSSNGRYLVVPGTAPGQSNGVFVVDVVTGVLTGGPRPADLPEADLVGISDDGSLLLWYDRASGDFTDDLLTVADRNGNVVDAVRLGHPLSFGGNAWQMSGQFHFSADGTQVLVIGARPPHDEVTERGVGYRWTVGHALEQISTSDLKTGVIGATFERRTSSWCDVTPDLRHIVVLEAWASPPVSVTIADLEELAPRPVVPEDVVGPQLSDQVTRLYSAFFGRAPDAGGLDHWVRQRAEGTTLVSVADHFAASAEFRDTYGSLDNGAFVDRVYQNVLGRSPDAGGREHWVAALSSGLSRGALMVGFSESPEFVEETETTTPVFDTRAASISRLYRAFFGRPGDAEGLTFWLDRIARGEAGLGEIASGFVQSDEFTSTYGALADDAFVDLVYRNVLDRDPDAAGRAFWVDQLAMGILRGEMMIGFSESPEYIAATDTLPPS